MTPSYIPDRSGMPNQHDENSLGGGLGKPLDPDLVLVFTGAGLGYASGMPVYWDGYNTEYGLLAQLLANGDSWRQSPGTVLEYYNLQRLKLADIRPSRAHFAIAELERFYRVIVVTQNIDDLHERAGSTEVLHLHGELCYSRSEMNPSCRVYQGYQPFRIGDVAPDGQQLRPDVVWFGENIRHYKGAKNHITQASKVLAIGTSLQVQPAAGLLKKARFKAEKILVTKWVPATPYGYRFIRGGADECVPGVINEWIERRR